jgi:hypothetical protein
MAADTDDDSNNDRNMKLINNIPQEYFTGVHLLD